MARFAAKALTHIVSEKCLLMFKRFLIRRFLQVFSMLRWGLILMFNDLGRKYSSIFDH